MLAQVPEVVLDDDQPAKDAEAARNRLAEQARVIAKQVAKDPDAFVRELVGKRPDLAGLPFRMGQGCNLDAVKAATAKLKDAGIQVSLFIDPDLEQVELAKAVGADAIEFQTASYSEAVGAKAAAAELAKLHTATAHATHRGLHVHMGHGLNYQNVKPVVRVPGVEELNIGHSIVSRAVLVGMERAVREMKLVMQEHYPNPRKLG